MNDADKKAFEDWWNEYTSKGWSALEYPDFETTWKAACEWRDSQVAEPVGWRVAFSSAPRGTFQEGNPDNQTIEYWRRQGIEFEYCYATPPAAQINRQIVEALESMFLWATATSEALQRQKRKEVLSLAQAALNTAKSGDV